MSVPEFLLRIAALVVLGGYLLRRRHQRAKDSPRGPNDALRWIGHPLDVQTLNAHLAEVRRDYFQTPAPTRTRASDGPDLLARSRRTVRGRSYFRRRAPEPDLLGNVAAPADAADPADRAQGER